LRNDKNQLYIKLCLEHLSQKIIFFRGAVLGLA
jgi:hypothetical protein